MTPVMPDRQAIEGFLAVITGSTDDNALPTAQDVPWFKRSCNIAQAAHPISYRSCVEAHRPVKQGAIGLDRDVQNVCALSDGQVYILIE